MPLGGGCPLLGPRTCVTRMTALLAGRPVPCASTVLRSSGAWHAYVRVAICRIQQQGQMKTTLNCVPLLCTHAI